jgi:hypothetical protein
MAWGASQEYVTLRGYEELGRTTTNPVLRELCARIARQERLHFAWYFHGARERLARSRLARWLTRTVLTRFWTPVGAGVKSDVEVAGLCRALFSTERFAEVAREVDSKLSTLPGMAGLAVAQRYAAAV